MGSILIYLSGLKDLPLVTEGVALIAIGAVGLIMSWTTQDIVQGIKDSVHDDGELTREGLREVTAAVREVGASVEAMAKDNREFFRKMIELQGAILDKQGAILDKSQRSRRVGARLEHDGGEGWRRALDKGDAPAPARAA